jgi:AraC-like DNA-binding protein
MAQRRTSRIRFSTEDLPPESRFAAWCEGFVHRRMGMDFVDRSTEGLRFAAELISLGGVAAGILQGTPSMFTRAPKDRNDSLCVLINRRGRFRVVQTSQQRDLAVGDAGVLDNRRPGELHYLEEGEAWSLSLPHDALRHMAPDIEQAIARPIRAADPALRLLIGYLEALFALDDIADPELAGIHLADLVGSALVERAEAPERTDDKGVREARLNAVLGAIAREAGDPDLDPARLAERLGISVRYLHRLLQTTGQTFSEHLGARRVERAYRLLRDPRLGLRKIGEIALEVGFNDLTHFNRTFRRRSGETPSAARVRAARKDDAADSS